MAHEAAIQIGAKGGIDGIGLAAAFGLRQGAGFEPPVRLCGFSVRIGGQCLDRAHASAERIGGELRQVTRQGAVGPEKFVDVDMGEPIDLRSLVEAMRGVDALARLMFLWSPSAGASAPVPVIAEYHTAFGMRAQGGFGLWVGGVKIDMHAVGTQIEMMGGEIEDVLGGGLDRGDHAPGGCCVHARRMRKPRARRKGSGVFRDLTCFAHK